MSTASVATSATNDIICHNQDCCFSKIELGEVADFPSVSACSKCRIYYCDTMPCLTTITLPPNHPLRVQGNGTSEGMFCKTCLKILPDIKIQPLNLPIIEPRSPIITVDDDINTDDVNNNSRNQSPRRLPSPSCNSLPPSSPPLPEKRNETRVSKRMCYCSA